MRNYKLVVNAFLSAHRLYFNVVCQLFRFCLFMLVQERVPRPIFQNYPSNVEAGIIRSRVRVSLYSYAEEAKEDCVLIGTRARRRDRYTIFIRRNKIGRDRGRRGKNAQFFLPDKKSFCEKNHRRHNYLRARKNITHCIIIM